MRNERNDPAGKYLTFRLGDEAYGIPVLRVREIIRMTDVTAVPQMPDHVRGVINLRGRIVPVIDLRTRFGLPPARGDGRTCILVVQAVLAEGRQAAMGVVVDAVEEVSAVSADDIEPPPAFGGRTDSAGDAVTGIAKTKGGVRILLDVDKAIGAGVPEEIAA